MSDLLLGSIFDVETTMASVSPMDFLICSVFSLVLGLIVGLVSSYKSPASKGFIASMGVLPVIVQTVILLVNGNLGAAVAVFGVFNLVRFRSMPGTAKDNLWWSVPLPAPPWSVSFLLPLLNHLHSFNAHVGSVLYSFLQYLG